MYTRKAYLTLTIAGLHICIVIIYILYHDRSSWHIAAVKPVQTRNSKNNTTPANNLHMTRNYTDKIILWYFPPRYIPKDINDLVKLDACPRLNCVITRNRTFLPVSDAVLFSAEHIQGNPPPRQPGQVWIFHNNEPPYNFAYNRPFHIQPWSSVFNWTMDFRHDSDIVRPYAVLRKRAQVITRDYTAIVKRKSKHAAMMVSNCINWSARLQYARILNKWFPVDIFGACGKNMFPREKNDEWLSYLNSTYMYYLGFENLYCKDYISEKLFNSFNLDLVTVARGGGNYGRDVPPRTFINAGDYKSPKHLAKYLWHLVRNPDKYIDILEEKGKYYYENEEYFYIDPTGMPFKEHYYEKQPLCELCQRLNNLHKYSKTIPDIVPWFSEGVCVRKEHF